MARMVVAQIVFNKLPRIKDELREKASQVVRKTAFDVQATAQQLGAVDTGAMVNSVYVLTSQDDQYGAAVARAKGLNPSGKALPRVEKPTSDLQAVVAVGMEYGVYQEMGTSRMAAHPFMTPAAEAARGPFADAMGKIVAEAGR